MHTHILNRPTESRLIQIDPRLRRKRHRAHRGLPQLPQRDLVSRYVRRRIMLFGHYCRRQREPKKVGREQAVASYDSTWKVFSPDGSIPDEGLRMVVEQAKAELKLSRDVPLNEIVELAPLRAAQKELGIQK